MEVRFYYASMEEEIYNISQQVTNMSNILAICTNSAQGLHDSTEAQIGQFSSISNYLLAFLQNLLANVLNINSIY